MATSASRATGELVRRRKGMYSKETDRTSTGGVMDLAQRLRDQRTFLNISQQFVADQTGIRRSAVSDIERGARRVDSFELKALSDLYRMPVNYFLGDDPEGADPTVQALARAAGKMGDEEKEQLLRFAAFLQNYDRAKVDDR
ncbi:MAG: helix-turn-helix domain-containing protein [Solirubrobacteraceae bacterium]|jgi:transcriptional regulator with XRE-family HTH domain